MKRTFAIGLMLTGTLGLGGLAAAQDATPGKGPGWTGTTRPEAVIAARQALMFAIEELMRPIDTYTVDDSVDPDEVTANANTIAAMLQAVPHLFPPTTNIYDPEAEEPDTLALPQIWVDFSSFYSLAEAATNAATTLSEAVTPDELRTGALALRATCDACHAINLRPYEPSEVTEEDLDFDFDSIFKKDQ